MTFFAWQQSAVHSLIFQANILTISRVAYQLYLGTVPSYSKKLCIFIPENIHSPPPSTPWQYRKRFEITLCRSRVCPFSTTVLQELVRNVSILIRLTKLNSLSLHVPLLCIFDSLVPLSKSFSSMVPFA